MKKILGFLMLFAVTIYTNNALASKHEAHTHGIASMNIVIEDNNVTISVETPLANILSFEHAPETSAQTEEVRAMLATLRKADNIVQLPSDAQCIQGEISLESGVLSHELPEAKEESNATAQEGHVEQAEHSGHGDLDIEMPFVCNNLEKLKSIEVTMFQNFPNLEQIQVQMVTPQKQNAATLTPKNNIIRW